MTVRTEQEMEVLALELLEVELELELDVPAKTCPVCGSDVESKLDG